MAIKVLAMTTEMSPTGVPNLLLAQIKAINDYNETVNDDKKIYIDILNNDHSRVDLEGVAKKLGSDVYHIAKASNLLKFRKEFLHLLKSGNYDVFHSHFEAPSFYPLLLAKKAGVKARIATAHNLYDIHGFSLTSIYIRLTRKFIHYLCTCLLAVSKVCGISQFGKSYLRQGVFLPVIAPWAKEFNRDLRIKKRNELGLSDSDFTIIQVGTLTKRKDPLFSLSILKKLKETGLNVKMVFIGEGPIKKEIEIFTIDNNLEDSVKFLGELTNLTGIFDAGDCLFMPSEFEGFGMAAIEGAANGLKSFVSKGVARESQYCNEVIRLEKDLDLWVESVRTEINSFLTNSECEINEIRRKRFKKFQKSQFFSSNAIKVLIDVYSK